MKLKSNSGKGAKIKEGAGDDVDAAANISREEGGAGKMEHHHHHHHHHHLHHHHHHRHHHQLTGLRDLLADLRLSELLGRDRSPLSLRSPPLARSPLIIIMILYYLIIIALL